MLVHESVSLQGVARAGLGEVPNWDVFCMENEVGCGVVDWEYPGSARELLEEVEVWISEVKVHIISHLFRL